MPFTEMDDDREDRISTEILVDTYDEAEQALGWYYYLENRLDFPFKAKWLRDRAASTSGEEVEVVGMASEDECLREMFVEVLYRDSSGEDTFTVPLADIEVVDLDPETEEAIADWHYWVDMGYELS